MNIDKILNKIINFLFVALLVTTIVILSLFVYPPTYALDSSNNTNLSFDVLYSTSNSSFNTSTFYEGYSTYQLSNNKYGYIYKTGENDKVYFFLSDSGNGYVLYNLVYETDIGISNDIIYADGVGGVSTFHPGTGWSTNSTYGFKYSSSYANTVYGYNINYFPYFNTRDEGFAALRDYIDNPPSPEPSLYEGINIPAGYIARIQVKNGSKFTMLTTMGTDNIAYQDKWVYTSQWYKFLDTASPETAISTDGITIPWARYGNTNILGQTNKAQYTINSTVGSYVWVLNPAYMVGQNADLYDTKLNSSIQLVDIVDVLQVRIFALKSTYTWGGIVSSTTTGSGIEYDPEIGNWINDNGDAVDPVDYGDTNVPTTGSNLIQQFETLLSNLINRIERLLVAPVDYINQLIQSANQFFLWLRGLWSWLPAPVVESITAVLIIMCTVGALKLLWR